MFIKTVILVMYFIFTPCFAKNYSIKQILESPLEKRQNINKEDIFPILTHLSRPEKIAFWGEFFIDTPYDVIPIGLYVKNMTIEEDKALDCMSLTFLSIELASASSEIEALDQALKIRFIKTGSRSGNYINSYEGRFKYGEDMWLSGKYGKNINHFFGKLYSLKSDRLNRQVYALPIDQALKNIEKFNTGDIIFFVKHSANRKVGELVGHIGILKREENEMLFLIHASGVKNKEGKVKKVEFKDYLAKHRSFFPYILVSRFPETKPAI